jgi:hypothetical protein
MPASPYGGSVKKIVPSDRRARSFGLLKRRPAKCVASIVLRRVSSVSRAIARLPESASSTERSSIAMRPFAPGSRKPLRSGPA